ncbi:MAG: YfhO family protein [Cyclobacteriaceae bacterium]|nr:YfhO family protein [Cyclobacteriaceae bacterium]
MVLNALIDDRKSLLLSDAFRSLGFILAGGIVILLMYKNILKQGVGLGIFIFLLFIDMISVDKRYLNKEMFVRSRENTISMSEADRAIMADKEPGYRVYNIVGNAWEESKTSNFHRSLGGYHGAKLRRYQELYDYCIQNETASMIENLRKGTMDFSSYSVINMLNAKYLTFGSTTNELLPNISANGSAWYIQNVIKVNDANEEIAQTCEVNSKTSIVVNKNKFPELKDSYTGTGSVLLNRYSPREMEYTVQGDSEGMVVFSEIYYPEGWTASIDGQPATIINANYVLRALEVPAGQHTIVFSFNPKSYIIGNKVTMISSLLTLFLFFGAVFIEAKTLKQ